MSTKLIDRIVLDIETETLNSFKSINEKLNYYREVSDIGISNLSDKKFEELHSDIKKFFNIQFTAYSQAYPPKLYRISFNKNITGQGRGGQLKKISQLLGPPEDKSNFNRCNLPGESMFYCALDFNTAIWETKPQANDVITVSEWKIKKGEHILLNSVFNHPDIDETNQQAKKIYSGFLKEMGKLHPRQVEIIDSIIKFGTEQFVKPVDRSKPRDYLFSSYFSSELTKKGKDGIGMDAIAYPSVQRKYGTTNIAIMNSIVLNKLELISSTTHDIVKTHYHNDPKSNNGLISVFPAFQKITEFDYENDKIIYPNPEMELQKALEKMMKK